MPVKCAVKSGVSACRIGKGIIKTVSISNTTKMIPNRKKRKEKGTRAEFFGSNPHSNAEAFSRSLLFRHIKNQAAKNVAIVKIMAAKTE